MRVESTEVGKGVGGLYLWRQNKDYSFVGSAAQGQGLCLSSTVCASVCVSLGLTN